MNFEEAQNKFWILRGKFSAGVISRDEYRAEVRKLRFVDEAGQESALDEESGEKRPVWPSTPSSGEPQDPPTLIEAPPRPSPPPRRARGAPRRPPPPPPPTKREMEPEPAAPPPTKRGMETEPELSPLTKREMKTEPAIPSPSFPEPKPVSPSVRPSPLPPEDRQEDKTLVQPLRPVQPSITPASKTSRPDTPMSSSEAPTIRMSSPVLRNCPSCGDAVDPGQKFCEVCGTALTAPQVKTRQNTCPNCHAAVPPGSKFCEECGTSLPASYAAASHAAPSPAFTLPGPTPPQPTRSPTPTPISPAARPAPSTVPARQQAVRPTPVSQPVKRKRKWLPWALGGLAFIAFACALVFLATSVFNLVAGGTSTYKSSDLGLSFQYPSNWDVDYEDEEFVSIISPDEDMDINATYIPDDGTTLEETIELMWEEIQIELPSAVRGSTEQATMTGEAALILPVSTIDGDLIYVATVNAGRVYLFSFSSYETASSELRDVMDEVIASFEVY